MGSKGGIQEAIKRRVLLLDGAMGTMIQSYGLQESDYHGFSPADGGKELRGVGDLLSLTRPDVIKDIHRRYLNAGADLIETNTFNSQRISLTEYGLEQMVRELNLSSCRLAKEAAEEFSALNPEKPRWVLGSIGPTSKSLSMSPDVNDPAARSITFDELQKAYEEQIEAMVEGGVDALLCETIFDTLNAKAFIVAAECVFERLGTRLPLMLSCTVADKAGRLLSGQTIEAFLTSIEHANLLSVGLNCGFGPRQMMPFIEELSAKTSFAVSMYPNAGLPNVMGEYDLSPDDMVKEIQPVIERSMINILGGCCGTTDAYIRKYADLIAHAKPRPYPAERTTDALDLAGLERLRINKDSNFISVGERLNVAGSRKFLRLISNHNYEEALSIARQQVEAGAQVLDINMDDGMLDAQSEMGHFLKLIGSDPDISRVPIMIDSSKWEVIREGLKAVQGKCIVNSISIKEGERKFLEHAMELRRFGAAAIVMAFDEKGQATTLERKIEVCQRAYNLLRSSGWRPNGIVFDPNILTIGTGMAEHANYARDFIEAARWIRTNLPGSHVSGGVSNLSFAFRGNKYLRSAMHAVFLYHAIKAGMDMGIVNPNESLQYEDLSVEQRRLLEDLIFNRRADATERVLAYDWSGDTGHEPARNNEGNTQELSVSEQIKELLRKGSTDRLEELLHRSLHELGSASAVIQGPLMAGMSRVGELFGEGKMFLPQVVKTARTMNRAVEILKPFLESESRAKKGGSKRAKVLLATVRGDVHDIGKNIVGVVMACNGYEIIDLGVMTPPELILRKAKEEKVDIIGLSGLITPSLEEMIETVRLLRDNGIDVPVLIGGATTSEIHTALKIAPVYRGPVAWVSDATQNNIVAEKLLNTTTHDTFVSDLKERQAELRRDYNSDAQVIPIEAARRNKPAYNDTHRQTNNQSITS